MRIFSVIKTSTMLSLMLAGFSSGAQQAANSSSVAPDDAAAATEASAPTVSAHSKIRIVRLSEVKGEVQLDRSTGKGFETPMTNLPIVEGNSLRTSNGVAEVEFEDNSTVRLAQDTVIEFPRLELMPGGAKASTIRVRQGTVYINLMNTKGNEFHVLFGKQTVDLPADSHVRLQLTSSQAELAVMHGSALLDQPAGVTTLGKNKTMTFNLANDSEPQIAKNVAEMPLDAWDQNAVQYHQRVANASAFGNAPYAYGLNDMSYYGSFISAPGCGGSMWRPYFTNAAWDPYGSGAWAYYPTAGYSWVSPYPWGWTAFHYGSWAYCQGVGWGWQPGGEWMGLANNGLIAQNSLLASSGASARPRPPAHPPATAQVTIIPVNAKSIPVSSLSEQNKFVFRSNSAGLGVPRGDLGKLSHYSGQVASHGAASMSVYSGGGEGERASASSAGRGYSAASSSSNMSSHSLSSAPSSSMSHGSASSAGASGGGGGRR